MASNIAAYEWQLNGTMHIGYEALDNHMHEMVIGQDQTWRDADITRVAGGPELEAAILTGYAWPAGRTQQIAYISPQSKDGHIHELVMLQDHPWSYADLMAQSIDAPPADGFALLGCALKAGGTKHVVYTGRDGHIHELSAGVIGMWKHSDLTQVTGAPLAEGALLVAYAWQAKSTRQVVYISGDGHLHELAAGAADRWSHIDLTYFSGAPVADGLALAGYAWETGGTKQVVYVGADRHVHEVMMDTRGTWVYTDLTTLIGAPDASNEVIAGHEWSDQFAKHVVYLDMLEAPHIHSLLLAHGSGWQHTDVTDLTGAQSLE